MAISNPYPSENKRKITDGLKKFQAVCEAAIAETLSSVIAEAMDVALNLHDAHHNLHLIVGDDYGWMVINDGRIMKYDIYATENNYGTAKDRLLSLKWAEGSNGWVAVLMAGMQAANYNISFEKEVMKLASESTKQEVVQTFVKQWRALL